MCTNQWTSSFGEGKNTNKQTHNKTKSTNATTTTKHKKQNAQQKQNTPNCLFAQTRVFA